MEMTPIGDNTKSIESPAATQRTSVDSKKNSNSISSRQYARMVRRNTGIEVAPNRVLWILYVFLFLIQSIILLHF
jgi:hypothetical protein